MTEEREHAILFFMILGRKQYACLTMFAVTRCDAASVLGLFSVKKMKKNLGTVFSNYARYLSLDLSLFLSPSLVARTLSLLISLSVSLSGATSASVTTVFTHTYVHTYTCKHNFFLLLKVSVRKKIKKIQRK